MIEELPAVISTFGFPIAITIYLLWERQSVTKELKFAIEEKLVGTINDLKIEIVKLNERIAELTRTCSLCNDSKTDGDGAEPA